LWEHVLAKAPAFEPESLLPTLVSGDIALTSTIARDGAGVRAQVARQAPANLTARARRGGRELRLAPADAR
jgi:hypothetical protein